MAQHGAARQEVYAALDSEREYQARRWGEHAHSVTEFLVYMRDYVEEALHTVTREADPMAAAVALDNVRKVAALGVACMEQHGAPMRPPAPPPHHPFCGNFSAGCHPDCLHVRK
jgi:hypothetical protein